MKGMWPLIIILSAVLGGFLLRLEVFTLPIQGKDAWRQSKTGWNIRYFVREDPNILNPRQPYLNNGNNIVRYEFPILQWSVAMVERVIGENVLVERLMVYLISLLTLLAVYRLAFLLTSDQVTSAIALWAFAFFPTFFYNATSIMPDSLALCFSLYYVLYFFRYLKTSKESDLAIASVFIALAGLTKLPYILLGTFSLVWFVGQLINRQSTRRKALIRFTIINAMGLLPVLIWYGMVIKSWEGNNIAAGFTTNFAGWPMFFSFLKNHILVNFPREVLNFPSLILFFLGIYFILSRKYPALFRPVFFFIPLLVLFLYFFYILNVIREGHDYYLMPFYPVFMLAIIPGIHFALQWKKPVKYLVMLLILVMPLLCWNKVKDYWDIKYAYFNPDFFTCRDQLSGVGTREDRAIAINDESTVIFFYAMDKSGYGFWNNHLPVLWIKDMIKREHPKYLYSDSRSVESQEGFHECISELVLTCGSINVFLLKHPDEVKL